MRPPRKETPDQNCKAGSGGCRLVATKTAAGWAAEKATFDGRGNWECENEAAGHAAENTNNWQAAGRAVETITSWQLSEAEQNMPPRGKLFFNTKAAVEQPPDPTRSQAVKENKSIETIDMMLSLGSITV